MSSAASSRMAPYAQGPRTSSHRQPSHSATPAPSRKSEPPGRQGPLHTGPHATVKNFTLRCAEGHTQPSIKAVAWNSTGSRVATACADRTVRVWYPERIPDKQSSGTSNSTTHSSNRGSSSRSTHVSSSGYTWELKGHTSSVEQISWDPTHSDRLASASSDRTVRVWEYRMLKQLFSIDLGAPVLHVAYSPDGRFLACGTKDETISIVDVSSLSSSSHPSDPSATAAAAAAATGDERNGDGDNGRPQPEARHGQEQGRIVKSWTETRTAIHQIVWSHSGHLLCLSTQQGTVMIYDASSTLAPSPTSTSPSTSTANPTQNTTRISTSDAVTETTGATQSTGGPWTKLHEIEGNTSSVFCLDFDPRGRYLAVGGADALVSLWCLHDWICVRTFTRLTQPVRSLSFSSCGTYLASASEERSVHLDLVATGEPVSSLSVPVATNALAWHPNKLCLAVVGEDRFVRLYQ